MRKSNIYLWMATSLIALPVLFAIGAMFYHLYVADHGLFWVVMFFIGYFAVLGTLTSLHEHAKRYEG